VLLVQAGKVNVVAALDGAAPLLDSEIVIAEVLCEDLDYVKRGQVAANYAC
jgi:hypothetical protein